MRCTLWSISILMVIAQSDYQGTRNVRQPSRLKQIHKPRLRRQDDYDSNPTTDRPGSNKTNDTDSYYSTSYYPSSDEDAGPNIYMSMTTDPPLAAKPSKKYDPLEEVNDQLTEDAWAALSNTTREQLKAEQIQVKKNWEAAVQHDKLYEKHNVYGMVDADPSITFFNVMCYQVGTTMYNAKKYLREYYRLRYAYYSVKDFELGYVVHEIVYKYTILLELFHNVQHRYYNQSRFFNIASSTYMVYMYTVILEQSQDIMHYCNVLHEIEKKFGHFEGDDEYGYNLDAQKRDIFFLEAEKERKLLKAHRKKLREQRNKQKKTMTISSTRRTRRPTTNGRFPLYYGWSIEDW